MAAPKSSGRWLLHAPTSRPPFDPPIMASLKGGGETIQKKKKNTQNINKAEKVSSSFLKSLMRWWGRPDLLFGGCELLLVEVFRGGLKVGEAILQKGDERKKDWNWTGFKTNLFGKDWFSSNCFYLLVLQRTGLPPLLPVLPRTNPIRLPANSSEILSHAKERRQSVGKTRGEHSRSATNVGHGKNSVKCLQETDETRAEVRLDSNVKASVCVEEAGRLLVNF